MSEQTIKDRAKVLRRFNIIDNYLYEVCNRPEDLRLLPATEEDSDDPESWFNLENFMARLGALYDLVNDELLRRDEEEDEAEEE